MYNEWKSIEEEKPIYNNGLLLKIIPNTEKYGAFRTEDPYITGKILLCILLAL